MPVIRLSLLWLILSVPCLPLPVQAFSCWITGGAQIAFGTLTTGAESKTRTAVNFSCQADYGSEQYASVCLNSIDTPPFKMTSTGDEQGKSYTLLFRIFDATDTATELSPVGSGNRLETTLTLSNNQQVSGRFVLDATIPAGQNDLPSRTYFNYALGLRLSWNSASRQDALTSCQQGSAQGESSVDSASSATATVSDGCYIQSVTPMNFGTISSTASLGTTRSSATLRARCPTGTHFSLGIDSGTHANGDIRQLCNDRGQCLRYGLWQDAAATQPWGNQRGNNALAVTATDGSVQNFTIYGVLPPQTLSGTGTFSDDVVITLTY